MYAKLKSKPKQPQTNKTNWAQTKRLSGHAKGLADRGDLPFHFHERMESRMDSAKRLPSHHRADESRSSKKKQS
jgi:hypothetical protein